MSAHLIGWGEMVWGALKTLPALPGMMPGLWRLLTLRPHDKASIGMVFDAWAQKTPDAPAVLFDQQRWTYAQFNAWANQTAWALKAAGIGRGDAVGVLLENRPEVLVLVLATAKIGAVATLFNHNQRGDVLAHSIRITAPKLMVLGDECHEAWASLPEAQRLSLCPQVWNDNLAQVRTYSETSPPETATLEAISPCYYIFTSGTTGLPKASIMTHYRWFRVMTGLGQLGARLKADDTLYCALPFYHNNALTVAWGAVLGAGASLAIGRKFSVSRFWGDVRAYRATAFCYIGEFCRYLLTHPPTAQDKQHAVRVMIGNGLRPEIWDQFQQRFGIEHIAEFYAASEGNNAFVNAFGLERTAGFSPLPYAIVAYDSQQEAPVRNPQGFMERVPKGGVGLLLTEITDKAPMDGYTDKAATQAKILRDVFERGDAWFNTGDLMRDQGFRHVQFVDRLGDTFRWKGENVATTEVEAALGAVADVQDAVVYGVEVPGADGRAGMAAITLKDGVTFDGADMARQLAATLPKYAVPLFIRIRPTQTMTSTFKFQKTELKREGFNLDVVTDPLYVLLDGVYQPLTASNHARSVAA